MSEKGINDMWMQCFEKAVKDQREVRDVENREGGVERIEGGGVGMEIVQYEAERGFWERRCKFFNVPNKYLLELMSCRGNKSRRVRRH